MKKVSRSKFILSNLAGLVLILVSGNSLAEQVAVKGVATKKQANEFSRTLTTAEKRSHFNFISKKLKENDLPKALMVIPMIESHYNPQAVSHVGAGGMWQLMPATAKENGISAGERFKVGPATVAALKYFKKLHQQFKNWELAVAAYNAGGGRVRKALNENPNATSVQQLNLPKETKNYVLAFQHMQDDLRNYEA